MSFETPMLGIPDEHPKSVIIVAIGDKHWHVHLEGRNTVEGKEQITEGVEALGCFLCIADAESNMARYALRGKLKHVSWERAREIAQESPIATAVAVLDENGATLVLHFVK